MKLHKFNEESEFGILSDSLPSEFEKNYKGFTQSLHSVIQTTGFVKLLALD
jgi:hypothetical protein